MIEDEFRAGIITAIDEVKDKLKELEEQYL